MFRTRVFTFATVLSMSAAAIAQTETPAAQQEVKPLTVGDPARAIDIEHWIKGDKFAKFEDGKVYVVEFWATWCGPCKTSMPHITKLQEQYKDYGVTFIGISDEPLATVTEFLPKKDKDGKTWNEKTAYTLTTDPDKSVHRDYMEAAQQPGIPTAFVVGKDAHIEWIGHPMEIDGPLESIVKDKWDREEFKATWEKEQVAGRESMKAQKELRTAMTEKNWDKVMTLLDAQIAAVEENYIPRFQKFAVMLQQMDQPAKAYLYGEELAKSHWEEAQPLNHIAWFVVDAKDIKTRDLDFALRLSQRAAELEPEEAAILDTLARVFFDKGDLKNAVQWQKKAVQFVEDGPMAEDLKTALKKYEDALAKKPAR